MKKKIIILGILLLMTSCAQRRCYGVADTYESRKSNKVQKERLYGFNPN